MQFEVPDQNHEIVVRDENWDHRKTQIMDTHMQDILKTESAWVELRDL